MGSSIARVSVHGGHSGQFCLHAKSTLDEVIQAYIAAGYSWVGITEHMPPLNDSVRYPDEAEQGLTAKALQEQFQRYFAEVALLLKPRGRLIMNAPINPAFAGTHDLAVGIRERFSPEQLISLSVGAGLRVKRCWVWPFVLSSAIWLVRSTQRLKMRFGASQQSPESDVSLPPPWINRALLLVCRLDARLFTSPWWGSSCFLVAEKSEH